MAEDRKRKIHDFRSVQPDSRPRNYVVLRALPQSKKYLTVLFIIHSSASNPPSI